MSLKIHPPQKVDGAIGANHVGVGAYLSPNLAQTWENGENYNHIEKFVIRIPKQGLLQNSDSGVLAESMVVSPKIYFSPLQV